MDSAEHHSPEMYRPQLHFTAELWFHDDRILPVLDDAEQQLEPLFKHSNNIEQWNRIEVGRRPEKDITLATFACISEALPADTPTDVIMDRAALHFADWLESRQISHALPLYADVRGVRPGSHHHERYTNLTLQTTQFLTELSAFWDGKLDIVSAVQRRN
jgi:hypothetical protein